MRLLVCGGRDYADHDFVWAELDRLHAAHRLTMLIQGGANGADLLARRWAFARDVPCQTYYPAWYKHGKLAGPLRNRQMLEDGAPDLVVAFPGGRGTANMVDQAKERSVEVLLLPAAGDSKKDP